MAALVSSIRNGDVVGLSNVEPVCASTFRQMIVERCTAHGHLAAFIVDPPRQELWAATADDARGEIDLFKTALREGTELQSLSTELPQVQAFERELMEDHRVRVIGHPWPKALRGHPELSSAGMAHPFFRVDGEGIHEVAVGPVHAGIIEPGHFRFQCHGETVLSLEIHLGYQRRGAEALLVASTPERRLAIAEAIAGDTAVGHALAFCQTAEALSGLDAPLEAQVIRGVALELERIHNHVGDLGALCNDIGYLPGASWFGRLRGEFLNLLMELSGSRFGRGLLIPGGVRFGLDEKERLGLVRRIDRAERDLRATAEVAFEAPSVASRFERTGAVSRETAMALGLVGPAGRASGCDRDVRRDHPSGVYRYALVPVVIADTGDVLARALVRWFEVQRSLRFVREQLSSIPAGRPSVMPSRARESSIAVSLVEGWRGEIAHVAITGDRGELRAYKIVDPSFHNWFGLAMALRDNEISDFPLCNKSFNLSYAGHDL